MAIALPGMGRYNEKKWKARRGFGKISCNSRKYLDFFALLFSIAQGAAWMNVPFFTGLKT